MSDYFDRENPSKTDIELKNEINKEPKMSFIEFPNFYTRKTDIYENISFFKDSFSIAAYSIDYLIDVIDKKVQENFLYSHIPRYITEYFKLFNKISINAGVSVSKCIDNFPNNLIFDKEPVLLLLNKETPEIDYWGRARVEIIEKDLSISNFTYSLDWLI